MAARNLLVVLVASASLGLAAPAQGAGLLSDPPVMRVASGTPSWATTAVNFVKAQGFVNRRSFKANGPMDRQAFKRLMSEAFGGGYSQTKGKVTAREVDAALVKALGKGSVAADLADKKSPNGWDPQITDWDASEIVAREMGLRHDRPTSEEAHESSANEPMLGADIAYAVWKAKLSPNVWGADEVADFKLDNYRGVRAKVVRFAFDQVGLPYVWAGEWAARTPAGYPYGAQSHGGVDCSGFVWYVLRANASNWHPMKRPYNGWELGDRSSSGMAAGTQNKIGFKALKPGDIMTFASGGRSSGAAGVYHAGLYLGKGWMIDSAGGQAGVSLSYVGAGSWWRDQFVWGRRVIH